MKFLRLTTYFLAVIISYVSLSAFEYLLIGAFLEAFIQSFRIKMAAMTVCLVIINPLVTYFITRNIGTEDKVSEDDIKLK